MKIAKKKLTIEDIPITASLIKDQILPVIISNDYPKKQQFIDGLIFKLPNISVTFLQKCAYSHKFKDYQTSEIHLCNL